MPKLSVAVAILVSVFLVACAGRAWDRALREDTAAAYAQFLREHPGSSHAQEARERSALVRVRANPTPEAYDAFLAKFPDSRLIPELRQTVEEEFFQRARASASAAAYADFLAEFGDGRFAARARGNLAYLEADGFAGRPEELSAFAAQHPQSDFALEAKRSVASLERRNETVFRRVGLWLDVAPDTPEADRLLRVFGERARKAYAEAGLALVPLSGPDDPRAAELPVRLTLRHREVAVRPELQATRVTSPGIQATTHVVLERKGEDAPVWSEEFTLHSFAPGRAGTSILFGPGSQPYWSSFFVPVARWNTQTAVRPLQPIGEPLVAVEGTATHAFALLEDGDFLVYEIGDPAQPVLAAEYRRPRDLARFGGLRVVGQRVLVYGNDGIEVVELSAKGPRRQASLGRDAVGQVASVEVLGDGLVVASKRGLLRVGDFAARPELLLDREIFGLARLGKGRVVFTDGRSLYVSTLALLRQKKVEGELRLGRGFGPRRVRVDGRTALVLGERGLVRVDLSRPSAPRALSRIDVAEVGRVEDALLIEGRLYVLGERGLQVADRTGERIIDAAPVRAHARFERSGRHLVTVGPEGLQVVDTTPFRVNMPAALKP